MEIIRLICLNQGIYDWMSAYAHWQQNLLIAIEKISLCGIGIGAAAGCVYGEIEEREKSREPWVSILVGITVLFILALLGGIQRQQSFQMSNLVRMGSYFIFPLIFIYIFRKMKAREDVGGHLIFFWLIVGLNMIYISLFQTAGELLVPYLSYQTILEILLIHWIFSKEMGSQVMMSFSVLAENVLIYNWYQGKIDFLKYFPSLGKWSFSWRLEDCGIVAVMIISLIVMIAYMMELKKEQWILLTSTCLGAVWELMFKMGMDGLFHIHADWQADQGILLIVPFIAVFVSRKLLGERKKAGKMKKLMAAKKKSL
jgi:hypothetical protein